MEKQREKGAAKEIGKRTGYDPIILAAVGSVLLSWYQFYVRGNKEHGLFIGLWPPTLLAFSNATRINDISEKVESKATRLFDRLM
ncbi:hypothetical protein [Natronomonas gomsonensis]|uniref:hypothetical protein n=1 Tax=Natronomonas gomsonensis TaxID=1046043 RepID=UPI0015B9BD52|nr:hypothetical protein [Natronomonas gomsonensis]